ncbi:MAG: DNA polymerase III subunit beta [Acidobacteriota bacterium]
MAKKTAAKTATIETAKSAFTFSANVSQLKRELDFVIKGAEKKGHIPILRNVLFEVDNGHLTIRATNLDCWLTTRFTVETASDAKYAFGVDAQRIRDYVGTLAHKDVSFSIDPDKADRVHVSNGSSKSKFAAVGLSEFPIPPKAETQLGSLPGALMKTICALNTFSGDGIESVRYSLKCIQLEARDGKLVAMATTGHHLARYEAPCGGLNVESSLIPSSVLPLIASICNGEPVTIWSAENNTLIFRSKSRQVSTKLMIGDFPKVEAIFKPRTRQIVAETQLLLSRARIAMPALDERTRKMNFEITPESVVLRAMDASLNLESEVTIPADLLEVQALIPARCGINAYYLTEILETCAANNIAKVELHFEITDGMVVDAIEICPVGVDSNGTNARFVVMPMK